MKGQLWVVASPSGGGKTSLIAEMVRRVPQVMESVSHTTRPARPNEIEGQHYFFITPEAFQAKVAAGEFLEYAQVYQNYYGTSAAAVDERLNAGWDVILSIDWQGAEQIMRLRPDTRTVFILPPSLSALASRLQKRGQDGAEVVAARMKEAVEQIEHHQAFEFIIVNDDFETAAAQLEALLRSARLLRSRCEDDLKVLLQRLHEERSA